MKILKILFNFIEVAIFMFGPILFYAAIDKIFENHFGLFCLIFLPIISLMLIKTVQENS